MNILCPTCHGRGSIPDPNWIGKAVWSLNFPSIFCRTCNGSGWVWVYAPAPAPYPYPASYPAVPDYLRPPFPIGDVVNITTTDGTSPRS